MTWAIILLVASYALLALLLLSLNLKSAWHWAIKAAAIGVTAAFFVVAFVAIEWLLGWPSEAAPPADFQLHAAVVREPARDGDGPGAIYLWLTPRDGEGRASGPPRAYALPYSRALHEQAARAQAKLEEGQRVDGRALRSADESHFGATDQVLVELYERLPPPLPPKSG